MRLVPLLPAAAGFVLAGCMFAGRDYFAPSQATPDAWTRGLSAHLSTGEGSLEEWWTGLGDPTLTTIINRTRESNPDLRRAALAIDEARALRGVARSQLFPAVGAGGDYVRQRASESLLVPAPGDNPSNRFSAGFDAGWELDFFGGLRRGVEAAEAGIGASVEAYRDAVVTLQAEAALNYIEFRTLQERIRLAQANIERQRESAVLAKDRFDAGLAPQIDVTQAETNLANTEAVIPQLETQAALAIHRIGALTGGYPGDGAKLVAATRPIPLPQRGYGIGQPVDLLRSRPDIRQAERQLAAQTARIGVAEADLYPRFALFGNFALQSVEADDLLDWQSRGYGFGPSFSWQIFSAGRIRSTVQAEEARTAQALAFYERTVLGAVEEVESALVTIEKQWDRLRFLERAVENSLLTVDLIKDNYRNGLVSFQNVLDAERTLFGSQDDTAVSRGQIARGYVVLFKALGGGVPVADPPEGGDDGEAASDWSSDLSSGSGEPGDGAPGSRNRSGRRK